MQLRERIKEELKIAMKSKDSLKVTTLRMVGAKLKDLDINARPKGIEQISETDIIAMLKGMIKSRNESLEIYRQANREDLVDKESKEIEIIELFLPKQLDQAQTEKVVEEAINKTGAQSIKEMGKVMAYLKEHYAAVLDFSKVNRIVKQNLS
ncbi:putative protein YqeY [Commensalibacter sp. Nvir]|uniref:GatB/YqeY domain-containing protein n=1 Tax=Commensalibacter sp. Nvir TaxID=3069817 RepID=UPI002D38FF02|nr:putative protein YqeY [Commensalibacter sp. Nvir]